MNQLPSILIVEDDRAIADMYTMKLVRAGYRVVTAYDGVEGYQQAKKLKPELILLDLMMPEMTGDELLEKIRAESWGSHCRVIILTNLSKDEAPMKLRLMNVDRYIVKAHYTPAQVLEIVEEILRKPRHAK